MQIANTILHFEICGDIFSHLPAKSLVSSQCVSKNWNGVLSKPEFWKSLIPAGFCPNPEMQGKEKEFVLTRTVVDEDELHVRIKEYIANMTLENYCDFNCRFIVKVTDDNKELVKHPNAQYDYMYTSDVWISPDNYGGEKDITYYCRSHFIPSCFQEIYDENEYFTKEDSQNALFDPQILYFKDWINENETKFGKVKKYLTDFMIKCSEDFNIGLDKLRELNPEIDFDLFTCNNIICYGLIIGNKNKFNLTDLQLEFFKFLSKLDHGREPFYLIEQNKYENFYTKISSLYDLYTTKKWMDFLEKGIPADIPYKDEYIAVLRRGLQSSVGHLHKMLVEKVQELYTQKLQKTR